MDRFVRQVAFLAKKTGKKILDEMVVFVVVLNT